MSTMLTSLTKSIFRKTGGMVKAPMGMFSTCAYQAYQLPQTAIVEKPLLREKNSTKDVMSIVREEIVKRQVGEDGRDKLFKRDGEDRAIPGDMMIVEYYTNLTKGYTSSFAGICIAIHRSGPTTSMTLRNTILTVGVEQKFRVFSPLIKSIVRVRRSRGFRRVKLYYLRDDASKARTGILKNLRIPTEETAANKHYETWGKRSY